MEPNDDDSHLWVGCMLDVDGKIVLWHENLVTGVHKVKVYGGCASSIEEYEAAGPGEAINILAKFRREPGDRIYQLIKYLSDRCKLPRYYL